MFKAKIKKTVCSFKEGIFPGFDIEIRDENDNFIQGIFVTELDIELKEDAHYRRRL